MPATLEAGGSGGDCVVVTPNAGSDAAPPVSSPVQAQSGVDGGSSSCGSSTKERSVLFRDVEDFERKRHAFATGGSGRLQIISGARKQRQAPSTMHKHRPLCCWKATSLFNSGLMPKESCFMVTHRVVSTVTP